MRPSNKFKNLIRLQMAARERVGRGVMIRPVGTRREVVFSQVCGGNPKLVSTTTPSASSAPGTRIPVLGPQGGSGLVAIESVIQGRAAGSEEQGHTMTSTMPEIIKTLALMATAVSGGEITFDIASFHGSVYQQTIHSDVVIGGFDSTLTLTDVARRSLLKCKPITGLSLFGVPDGSLLMFADDESGDPNVSTVHIVDITDGSVTSAAFAPTAIKFSGQPPGAVGNSDRIAQAWDIINGEIYVLFAGFGPLFFDEAFVDAVIIQPAKFTPELANQTIFDGIALFNTSSFAFKVGGNFFLTNMIHSRLPGLVRWDLVSYAGGRTDGVVSGGVNDPGAAWGNLPQAIGLASDGRYYTVADATGASGIPVITSVLDADEAAATGWQSPFSGEPFIQTWNGTDNTSVWNLDRSGNHIYGFPVAITGSTPNLMRIALTAATWADADSLTLETTDFRPDSVVPDSRDPTL